MKKWGGGLKKILKQAKKGVPLRKNDNSSTRVDVKTVPVEHSDDVDSSDNNNDVVETQQPQNLEALETTIVSDSPPSKNENDTAQDIQIESQPELKTASSSSQDELAPGTLKHEASEEETGCFVPRVSRHGLLDHHLAHDNLDPVLTPAVGNSNSGDEAVQSEGVVDVDGHDMPQNDIHRTPNQKDEAHASGSSPNLPDTPKTQNEASPTITPKSADFAYITNNVPARVNESKRSLVRSASWSPEHDRSSSESTLIDPSSPVARTPSPRERAKRPGDIKVENFEREGAPFEVVRNTKAQNLGFVDQKDYINKKIEDAVAKTTADLKSELTQRVAEAKIAGKEAADREWQAVIDALDYNHRNQLDEVEEEHQELIDELNDKHAAALAKQKAKHEREVSRLREAMRELRSAKDDDNKAMETLTAKNNGLATELTSCKENLETALGNIQTREAEEEQAKRQGEPTQHSADAQPTDEYGLEKIGDPNAMTPGERQAREALAICDEQYRFYFKRAQDLNDEREQETEQSPLVEALRDQATQYWEALQQEKRERKLEKATFSDAVDLAAMGSRNAADTVRWLQKSNDKMADQNEELLAWCSNNQRIPLNEFDRARAEHHEHARKEIKELRDQVRGYQSKLEGMQAELNSFRAGDRVAEAEHSAKHEDDEEKIRELEAHVSSLQNDNETLRIENEIAQQDQEKREPDVWRVAREKVLREKEEEIAGLRCQLLLLSGEVDVGPSVSAGEVGASSDEIFESYEYPRTRSRYFRDV